MSAIERLPLSEVGQAEPEDRHAAQFDPTKHVEECFLCGRGLTQKAVDGGWWVRLATDGSLFAWDDEERPSDLDQGCFPVGSECARRIPKAYRGRMES